MSSQSRSILLAEDEPQVRSMLATILRGYGYNVLEAIDGKDALKVAKEHQQEVIDLLLTDVVMPFITGPEVAEEFKNLFPNANIILMSGYTEESILKDIKSNGNVIFLEKPFLPRVLMEKIEYLLN